MDRRSSAATTAADDADFNPGAAFLVYTDMEKVSEKLKLLDYDKDFVISMKMRPLHKYYFALPTNPGEQFFTFTSLCAWLIRKCGKKFDQPQEFDDPNATIAKILDYVRTINVLVDFPPNRLKQGVGEHAVYILNNLCDNALKAGRFSFKKPIVPEEDAMDEEVIDDDCELILEKVEEEMLAEYTSDDENDDVLIKVDDLRRDLKMGGGEFIKQENILESNLDVESWRLELERVLPQLKVVVKSDSRDWRVHLEQMKKYKSTILSEMSGTKGQLEALHTNIGQTMEKITSRERFLNNQLEPQLAEYRKIKNELEKTKGRYKEVSGGVEERSRTLSMLSEELDSMKHMMEERGASMTDGTPLVKIKKALGKVKSEITMMDIAIAVLDNELISYRIRDKALLQQEFGADNALF